jgi:hypothetical protein
MKTPTPALQPTATSIRPRLDAVTGRTVCRFQPSAQPDQVDLFSATGVYCGTAAASDWPADPQRPAAPDPIVEARREQLDELIHTPSAP